MNHLQTLGVTRNRYFVMRHGQSQANLAGLIASHANNALDGYGLTDDGRQQVSDAIEREARLDANTRILSSDFRRARESAAIAHAALGCSVKPEFDPRLRERGFGEFELGGDDAYELVWQQDEISAEQSWRGVESANRVMQRVTSLIVDCENRMQGVTWLLVSHGDILQILLTAFAREPASAHRRQPHLQTAEIRESSWRGDSI